MKLHIIDNHGVLKLYCDKCEYKTPEKRLQIHKHVNHEGNRYECDLCNFKTTNPGTSKEQKNSIQDGIKYYCYKCSMHLFLSCTQKNTSKQSMMEMGLGENNAAIKQLNPDT